MTRTGVHFGSAGRPLGPELALRSDVLDVPSRGCRQHPIRPRRESAHGRGSDASTRAQISHMSRAYPANHGRGTRYLLDIADTNKGTAENDQSDHPKRKGDDSMSCVSVLPPVGGKAEDPLNATEDCGQVLGVRG